MFLQNIHHHRAITTDDGEHCWLDYHVIERTLLKEKQLSGKVVSRIKLTNVVLTISRHYDENQSSLNNCRLP
jgi:hypothetical protein